MSQIKTIEGIELSSLCELACKYCINADIDLVPGRRREIMSDEIFGWACHILQELVDRGTQGKILNMNGNGESLLDPDVVQRARMLKSIVGQDRKLQFSTNGIRLTLRLAMDLRAAGVDNIEISPHSVLHAAAAAQHIGRARFSEININLGTIGAPHEWAGQKRWLPHGEQLVPEERCIPLKEGRIYIQSDGSVVPCCYDYQILSGVGHISDTDILEQELVPYELCKSCHQGQEFR